MENRGEVIIYKSEDNQTQFEVKFDKESVWLSQKQLSSLFNRNIMTINEHIRNIYTEGELDETTSIWKSLIVQKEGNISAIVIFKH